MPKVLKKQVPETVFSYGLSIDTVFYNNFGTVTIKQIADGYGTSGCCTSELTVSVPVSEYEENKPKSNASVVFIVTMGDVVTHYVYYIANRRKQGGKVDLVCYDRMAYTDVLIDINSLSFIEDKITAGNLVRSISLFCGFSDVINIDGMGYYGGLQFTKEQVSGKTCRALLEEVSKAWCGYFKVTYDNKLSFMQWGLGLETSVHCRQYTSISEGGEKGPIIRVEASNGNDTFTAGEEADVFQTLKVSTSFASQEYAEALLFRIKGAVYKAWSCSKAVISGVLPEINAWMSFTDDTETTRTANYLTLTFSGAGIFCSCGANEVSENEFEYLGALSRELAKKITDGEILGNRSLITRYQGIVFLPPEGSAQAASEEEKKVSSYGFTSADENGVVQFDGAMTSKVVPSSATINAEGTEAYILYGSKKFKYNIERDSDGNISGMTKEEVKEE